jgi:hypothetical protein
VEAAANRFGLLRRFQGKRAPFEKEILETLWQKK